jgi:hypothetical protein
MSYHEIFTQCKTNKKQKSDRRRENLKHKKQKAKWHLSVDITLNVNGLNNQSKGGDYQTRFKNKKTTKCCQ